MYRIYARLQFQFVEVRKDGYGDILAQVTTLSTLGTRDHRDWKTSNQRRNRRNLLREAQSSRQLQDPNIWKSVWNLNVNLKNKHFIWKCLPKMAPTNELIYSRTVKGHCMCPRCGDDVKTLEHMIFFCNKARVVWELAPINWDGLSELRYDFWKWWEQLLAASARQELDRHISLTVYIIGQRFGEVGIKSSLREN